jgi:hypothetical protein
MNMLTIVEGSLEKIKAELKVAKKLKSDEEKELKKKIKNWVAAEKKAAKEEKRKENDPPKEFDQKIAELEGLQKMFTGFLPVRVGDIVIDYKTYQRAVNKLKDLEIELNVTNKELVMSYGCGTVHLYDISSFFRDLRYIPVASTFNG